MPKNYVYMKYFTFIKNFTYGNTVTFEVHLYLLLPLLYRFKVTKEVLSSTTVCHQACSLLT
jgi:hypothetical protein